MTNAVDKMVGARIRQRRIELGMTQTELAEQISVRFQQVQKYENGLNRVAASRLWNIAEALRTPVSYFFDVTESKGEDQSGHALDMRRRRELVELFCGLSDAQQSAVMSFLRSMHETGA